MSNPSDTALRPGLMPCPHCETRLRIRHSEATTATCRHVQIFCPNPDCGWRGVATITIDSTSIESEQPNPRINLPLSQSGRRRLERALADDSARRVDMGARS